MTYRPVLAKYWGCVASGGRQPASAPCCCASKVKNRGLTPPARHATPSSTAPTPGPLSCDGFLVLADGGLLGVVVADVLSRAVLFGGFRTTQAKVGREHDQEYSDGNGSH